MRVRRAWRWGDLFRWVGGVVVAALACWWLVRDVAWAAVWGALRRADYGWVAVGVAAIVGTFFTRALRWRALLGERVPLRTAMTALLTGQVVNLVLPRVGDVTRTLWLAPEEEVGVSEGIGTVAVEKVWDVLALLGCGILLVLWMPLPVWMVHSTWWAAGVVLVGGVALVGWFRWREVIGRVVRWGLGWLIPPRWREPAIGALRRMTLGVDTFRRPRVAVAVALWTALTWGLGAVANWAVMGAFGIGSMQAAVFLLAALMVGGTVPVPGRLGVFEGVCVVSLALFGVSQDVALAVGVVLHLVVMGPPAVGAMVLGLWPQGMRRGDGEA